MASIQPSSSSLETKKARNRLSQQAFRRRQALKLKVLKDRAESIDRPNDATYEKLQQENHSLRSQLLDVQAKLSRLMEITQRLSTSIEATTKCSEPSLVLHSPRLNEVPSVRHEQVTNRDDGTCKSPEPLELVAQTTFASTLCPGNSTDVSQDLDLDLLCSQDVLHDNLNLNSVPKSQSYEYHMGAAQYEHSFSMSQMNSSIAHKPWATTNSAFSDHIQILQQFLLDKLGGNISPTPFTLQRIYNGVLTVLSLFNSVTRPDAMSWYAKTRFYHIADLTTWQLCPCPKTYEKVHPLYRPTANQLSVLYPSVIDWIPFPSIREKLIRLHAGNPQIDRIFCDAVSAYVVEACMSDIVSGAAPSRVYLRVNDLLTAGGWDQVDECGSWAAALPVPKVNDLFTSPGCARAAFQYLSMDGGASRYKMDPAFFGKYPELYDASTPDILAQGIPLKPDIQPTLTYPQPLDISVYQIYRSFIGFTVSSISDRQNRYDALSTSNSTYSEQLLY